MGNLPGNQYAEDHDEMYHNIGVTVVSEEGQTDATLIWSAIENHATATLALAYEQRTANLMKLWEIGQNDFPGEMMTDVENQMLQRLGLGDTK